MATSTGRLARVRERVPHELVAFSIGGLVAVALAIYLHEYTHQQLFADYGCEASIQWFPPHRRAIAITTPGASCWSELPPSRSQQLYRTQLLIEAVGYQLIPLYGLLGGTIGLFFALLHQD